MSPYLEPRDTDQSPAPGPSSDDDELLMANNTVVDDMPQHTEVRFLSQSTIDRYH